jgi:hypothetical protein
VGRIELDFGVGSEWITSDDDDETGTTTKSAGSVEETAWYGAAEGVVLV